MSINNSSPIFKFVSLRNPKVTRENPEIVTIQPSTNLTTSLESIINGNETNQEKINSVNALLQSFIESNDFIKNVDDLSTISSVTPPSRNEIEILYNNILVRVLTKSNTNKIYGMLVKLIKEFALQLPENNRTNNTVNNVRILIPESITFTFLQFESENDNSTSTPTNPIDEFESDIQTLDSFKKLIANAKRNNIVEFLPQKQVKKINTKYSSILNYVGVNSISFSDAQTKVNDDRNFIDNRLNTDVNFPQDEQSLKGTKSINTSENENNTIVLNDKKTITKVQKLLDEASLEGVSDFSLYETIDDTRFDKILVYFNLGSSSVDKLEKLVDEKLKNTYEHLPEIIEDTTYAYVNKSWIDISTLKKFNTNLNVDFNTIISHSGNCSLKYPMRIADLRIIEQQTVGYIPGEIAHINNTQKGEKNTRVTRRLKKVESTETIINESELTRETDSQSTEKFSLEQSSFEVQQDVNNSYIDGSISATYGPVSATVNAGYSSSSSETSGMNLSQEYSKEIINKIIDKVSNRVRNERSVKTIEEFEETVTHEINNIDQETKSYVYRWLNKLVRGTLKNYGKRLFFELQIAHPSSYFLSRMLNESPTINLPQDPKTLILGGESFKPQSINRLNYVSLSKLYNIKIENPPVENIIVSEVFNATSENYLQGKLIAIKDGYECKSAKITNTYFNGWPFGNMIGYMVGTSTVAYWTGGQDDFWTPKTVWLNNETGNLPISIIQRAQGFIFNIEISCQLTEEAMLEWQTEAYYQILDAYERLKSDVESKVSSFDLNAPGLSPEKKQELIFTELKRESLRKMHRCNPFWVNDRYIVGNEYSPNCCVDNLNAEKVSFLESVFDWNNMTYDLHPYFYNNKSQWSKLLDIEDEDPRFDKFLKSSYATVRIPVFRDSQKEIAACNFIVNNSIANYDTIPEGFDDILKDISLEPVGPITYDLDDNEIPVPKYTLDLGIFPIPTSLVILECSNQDGVKPIGFPQSDVVDTDLIIPKQYSPSIISDNCQ